MPYKNGIYIAENVDTEKMLERLMQMREIAHADHLANVQIEQKRYEQELKDIQRFIDMFYCSNYEKAGADNG